MITTIAKSKNIIAGLITAGGASICCITPVLAFLGGAGSVASSFSWIEPVRPYLVAATVAVFAFAWYHALKPQKQEDCGCDIVINKSFWQSKMFLSIATLVAALLLLFPYYAKSFYPKAQKTQVVITDKSDIRQLKFTIKGMTCEGCTAHVDKQLAGVDGVINFHTSYEQACSIVTFDASKTSADSVTAAINETGYKVVAQIEIKN